MTFSGDDNKTEALPIAMAEWSGWMGTERRLDRSINKCMDEWVENSFLVGWGVEFQHIHMKPKPKQRGSKTRAEDKTGNAGRKPKEEGTTGRVNLKAKRVGQTLLTQREREREEPKDADRNRSSIES